MFPLSSSSTSTPVVLSHPSALFIQVATVSEDYQWFDLSTAQPVPAPFGPSIGQHLAAHQFGECQGVVVYRHEGGTRTGVAWTASPGSRRDLWGRAIRFKIVAEWSCDSDAFALAASLLEGAWNDPEVIASIDALTQEAVGVDSEGKLLALPAEPTAFQNALMALANPRERAMQEVVHPVPVDPSRRVAAASRENRYALAELLRHHPAALQVSRDGVLVALLTSVRATSLATFAWRGLSEHAQAPKDWSTVTSSLPQLEANPVPFVPGRVPQRRWHPNRTVAFAAAGVVAVLLLGGLYLLIRQGGTSASTSGGRL